MTESFKNGVILCKCHGRIADSLPLDEVGQFLRRMAPDIPVIVGDDLCQLHALPRLIEAEGLQPLVIGACSKLRPKSYFGMSKVDFASTRIVDLLEEISSSSTEVAERIKLLLWAQVKRAREFKGIRQHKLKVGISRPGGKVSRRELLTIVLPRYEVIPYVEPLKCIGADRCRLCQDSCPLQAISIEEEGMTIDKGACGGCGACVAVCPQRAISYPTFSFEELDNEMEGLLLALGLLEPRIIALTCRGCLPRGDGGGQFRYPPNILPLEIPCLAMAHPWFMLRAFDMGAQGLALIKGECQAGFDATAWQSNIRFVRAILDCWNIKGRIRAFEVAEGNDIERELGQFAWEIARLGQTPLRASEPTPVPAEGLRLPALIKGLGNKLTHSLEGTISTGTVPFGRIWLDDTQCTGCGLCALNCPTKALTFIPGDEPDAYRLLFSHDSCIGCGACVRGCPEKCLRLEHVLELDRLGRSAVVLTELSIGRCRWCGTAIAPLSMLASLKARILEYGGPTEQLDLCPACRMKSGVGQASAY